jgi:hypothetical protein
MKSTLQRIRTFLTLCASVGALALMLTVPFMMVFLPRYQAERMQAVSVDGFIEGKEMTFGGFKSVSHFRYFVIVRQKTGGPIRLRVTRSMYEEARVGMPARKAAGEQWPHIGKTGAAF